MDDIRAYLPLRVEEATGDADGVAISGASWRLRVNTNWRLLAGGRLVASSGLPGPDASPSSGLDDLLGDELVDVGFRSSKFGFDLSATTSQGRLFEIASDFPYGEWIFSVWSRDDPKRIPIFDLEGPVSEPTDR
ncbi:hypothetical protein [Hamadaea tsunoensis]|uniref:hypothetical protein n=1 Tax=Hamadaea tsunoensis TaxID=53368 RepID=UPI0012FBCD80|nr:hypothetical protein [Hamadaea tsunoensis]